MPCAARSGSSTTTPTTSACPGCSATAPATRRCTSATCWCCSARIFRTCSSCRPGRRSCRSTSAASDSAAGPGWTWESGATSRRRCARCYPASPKSRTAPSWIRRCVAATIDELAAADAVFTVDTGMCTVWAARLIRATAQRRMLGSFVHGSMANALPQAIGAQLPDRGRQVIAMCGDGGFAMLMGDFLTLLQYDLPVKVVIFDNGSLGMVALEMLVAGYPPYQTALKNPDFAAVARAAGMTGIRIEDPDDVHDGLREALATDGPVLVDVVTDPNALSMPPKITGEQVKGFALAMSRLVLSGDADEVVNMARSNLRNLPRP